MSRRPSIVPASRRWGIAMALLTAIISGFAIFINSYGVKAWSQAGVSSTAYTTAKNLVAGILLLAAVSIFSIRRSEDGFTPPSRMSHWLGLSVVGILGGGVAFLLFFEGLSRAASTQGALIHKSLLIWVGLLAVVFLREKVGFGHLAALGLLVAGQLTLAGGIQDLALGAGELMILAATLIWAVEVVVAKRLLSDLSPLTVGAIRMGVGLLVLVSWGLASGGFAGWQAVGWPQWGWALATGVILTGYVVTWFVALARAPAVDVTAVLVFSVVITAALQSAAQGSPFADKAWGLGLVTLGAMTVLVSSLAQRRRSSFLR